MKTEENFVSLLLICSIWVFFVCLSCPLFFNETLSLWLSGYIFQSHCSVFLEHCLKLFSLWKLLKLMFVDFKLSIIQAEVNDYLI